jgi:zinc transport system substrate-binding protein
MKHFPRLLKAAILALAAPLAAHGASAAPRVVADILPVQSIAARVMEGAGTPDLLVPPGASPHDYALRPSDARALQNADVVFWIGAALTPWLEPTIGTLSQDAEVAELIRTPGLARLPFRDSATFEPHSDGADHGHDEEHGHGATDPHIWLDPENAVAIARAMAEALSAADPENADLYAANADAFATDTRALADSIAADLAPVRGRRFVVFHDAFHYFEARFDLEASGAISLGDARRPSAARIAEIRDDLGALNVACVFSEPQFDGSLIRTVVEGTGARAGTLDPLGARLDPGPALYGALLAGLATSLTGCLSGE